MENGKFRLRIVSSFRWAWHVQATQQNSKGKACAKPLTLWPFYVRSLQATTKRIHWNQSILCRSKSSAGNSGFQLVHSTLHWFHMISHCQSLMGRSFQEIPKLQVVAAGHGAQIFKVFVFNLLSQDSQQPSTFQYASSIQKKKKQEKGSTTRMPSEARSNTGANCVIPQRLTYQPHHEFKRKVLYNQTFSTVPQYGTYHAMQTRDWIPRPEKKKPTKEVAGYH